MNKKWIGIIVAVVVLIIIVAIPVSGYNSILSMQSNVEEQESNIKTQLQRRADLIPNLVSTVKGYSDHETEVFASVTQAREKMMSAGNISEMSAANDQMTAALGKLIAVAEAYPELKADKVYIGLMDELAGTENRIAVARTDYNADVKSYNLKIRKFPTSILAGIFGFEKADYFESSEGAATVPEVSF